MPNLPIHLQSRLRAVDASRDRTVYGADRDFDYLDDPYELASQRGIVYGTRVA